MLSFLLRVLAVCSKISWRPSRFASREMSQTYKLCEIAKNNGQHGKPVWIIVKGVVYDVTNFINEHPGGDNLILDYAGRDATRAFNEVGHSTDAIQELKLYKIGSVAAECTQLPNNINSNNTMIEGCPPAGSKQQEIDEKCCRNKRRIKLFFCF